MTQRWVVLAAALTAALLTSCTSVVYHGGAGPQNPGQARLFLPAFQNATDDEHAGRALTELMATALLERGYPAIQTESALVKSRGDNGAGPDGLYLEAARSLGATHLIVGIVHEYRYKTDLDGDPAVGISARLVDARDGRTLWQGSAAKVGVWFPSLTTAAQHAARRLADKMPLTKVSAMPVPPAGAIP